MTGVSKDQDNCQNEADKALNEKTQDEKTQKALDPTKKGDKDSSKTKGTPAEQEEELSEEDQELKSELDMLIERLTEPKADLYESALETLKNFIRTSTSSMTAVPKPLKFLRPHYPKLTEVYESWPTGQIKDKLADILSVLGMTYSGDGKLESLKYRLLSTNDDIGSWGHEYVRHLALEIGQEYNTRSDNDEPVGDLLDLSLRILPYFLKHNAEADAVDLLLEVEAINRLPPFVDSNTFGRVCLYMVSCVPLLAPPDDSAFLHTAYQIYLQHGQLPQALALAIKIDDQDLIMSVFSATTDKSLQKQLAFILARQQYWFELDLDEDVQNCMSNLSLSDHFIYLAKELNLLDPKEPEDIYKSHLDNSMLSEQSGLLESAKQNLAAAFVNAFVNCGYGSDKLLFTGSEKTSWIYKTKGGGMASTTASLGSLFQWNYETGTQEIEKYLHSSEEHIQAGALLGLGIVNSGVHTDQDLAFALLGEQVENSSLTLRASAIFGLGLAYAGSRRDDLAELLYPIVLDTGLSMELSALAALSLGHIFVGSANSEVTSNIIQAFLERDQVQLSDPWARFMVLGLALLYMGKNEETEEILETLKAIDHPIAQVADVLVTVCSYSGTGNVLQIQKLLQRCTSRPEEDSEGKDSEKEAKDQDTDSSMKQHEDREENEGQQDEKQSLPVTGYSVLGIAAIAMGEDIGQEMVLRHFGHLMHYGDDTIKRAVPLAMGLVSASNPEMKVFDTLSRYSHDSDLNVAANAIFAMGMVGAGTNNARLAQLLRQLALYYLRDQDTLFMVRVAQGLVHLGKGTLTINPFNTDRQILSRVSMAGLLTVCVALLDPKTFILSSSHSLLYYLTTAIRPRMLITLNEDLEPIKVSVRVGQAVDVVGQAGKPKTITGWVTHSTPVLLGYGERAELEDDEYISLASSLEGVVILRKNPDRMEVDN